MFARPHPSPLTECSACRTGRRRPPAAYAVTEQCYYSATLSWIKLNSAPESPLSGLCHTVAAHDEQLL